jgi:hypothetical protein
MTNGPSELPQKFGRIADGLTQGGEVDPAPDSGLAPHYREALALEAAGVEPEVIAEAVEVPLESLGSFLKLAHAKQSAEEVT